MKPTITINEYPIGWEWLDRVPLEDFNWLIEIFATLTDDTDTYLRYLKQEINPWYKHSTYIRLKLREILKVNLTDITIIDIISLP